MPRRGENIYKRKDGRWEARYIYSFKEDGSPRYRSIYAADYLTVKKKQNDAKRKMDPRLFQSVRMKKNISFYGLLWLERLKPSSKESTYVRYHYLFSHYISPMIGDRLVYTFSNKDCEVFLNKLLLSGKSDGSGLAPKTVTDIRSVIKLILKTAEKEGELSLCNPELCPVKPVRKPLRILSLKEQQALQDYLLGNLTHKNIGTLIALYTGVRLGELCAMQWKDIHFQEQYLEISKTLHRVTGPMEDWCKSFIRENDVNIEMRGFVPNNEALKIIANSKALVLPTQCYEGFPMSIVEAFSVGTPVICSDLGNAGSVVEEGITGYKFTAELVDEIIQAVKRCHGLCSQTKKVYKDNYSVEKNYELIGRIYKAIQMKGL